MTTDEALADGERWAIGSTAHVLAAEVRRLRDELSSERGWHGATKADLAAARAEVAMLRSQLRAADDRASMRSDEADAARAEAARMRAALSGKG